MRRRAILPAGMRRHPAVDAAACERDGRRRDRLPCYFRMRYWNAIFAFVVAMATAGALTPVAARLARRVGAVAKPSDRGLARQETPLLGGIAILAGVVLAAAIWVPDTPQTHLHAIVAGACLITLVGAVDDLVDLKPVWKLLGQIAVAIVVVQGGVKLTSIVLPFAGQLAFPRAGPLHAGPILSVIFLVGVMNAVNFSDGVDGLAAGLCTIDGIAFSILAFDLARGPTQTAVVAAAILAATTAGGALGFLVHNFHPASVFMGDSGSNLLGYLLGVAAIQGSLKTQAVVALIVPLVILAVPFLDTAFVVLKRLKYGQRPWSGDTNHFHHRMARIGFSQTRTVAYLYAWTVMLAGVAIALRFVPYHDHHPPWHYHLVWVLVMAAICLLALGASVYLVYVLEIFKFKRLRVRELQRLEPDTAEHEIEVRVQREVQTGDFERLG
jgi:UDP-GlcNAc:undecaprenyl-phosphate/decaprenyl-phosphate GlcNAc-1-phosphate transferase